MRLIATLFALAAMAAVAPSVLGKDGCADILEDGTFTTEQLRDKTFYDHLLVRSFARAASESASKSWTGDATIPIGDLLVGAKFDSSSFKQRQEDVKSLLLSRVNGGRDIDYALSSGDPEIVGAWLDCMRNANTPLAFHIEMRDSTSAVAVVFVQGSAGRTEAVIAADTVLPEGVSISDGRCLSKGTRIKAGNKCETTLSLRSAWTSASLLLKTRNHGDHSAYLAPRIYLKRVDKTRVLEPLVLSKFGIDTRSEVKTSLVTPMERTEGWYYDASSLEAHIETLRAFQGSKCARMKKSATPYGATYGYTKIGKDSAATTTCRMTGTIRMVRQLWAPRPSQEEVSGPTNSLPQTLTVD